MGLDILTSNVRDKGLIPESITVEDQARLSSLERVTEVFCSQAYAEFERHIESRQSRRSIYFDARQVMDAESATGNYFEDFMHSYLTAIILFQRTASYQTTVEHCKHYRIK